MNSQQLNKKSGWVWGAVLLAALALTVAFAFPAAPAFASPLPQDGTPYPYPDDATPTVTSTIAASPTVSPAVTATAQGTLPPPRPSGTPTQLVPVTGADLNGDGPSSTGMWVALWLVGLLLVGFGARARLRQP